MISMRPAATHALAIGALLLLAVAALLAACSSPTATTGPGTSVTGTIGAPGQTAPGNPTTGGPGTGAVVDACSLLSDADIKEITGFDVGEKNPDPADTTFPSACEWKLANTNWLIALGVASPGGQATWNALVPYTQGEAVSGIGDEAFLAEAGGDLMVRRGDTFFDIQYVAVGEAEGTQDRLAKRVLENLP